MTSQPKFNPTCPTGSKWYACGTGSKFVGCCATNPCSSDAGCSAGNLRAASFDVAYYGTEAMPDQQCANAGVRWYSCTLTHPPFLGCCSVDPCANITGCPQQNLVQGLLSSSVATAEHMDPQPPLQTSTGPGNPVSTGAVVGVAVGGGVVLIIAIACLWFMLRRRRDKRRAQNMAALTKDPARPYDRNSYLDTPSPPTAYSPSPGYGFQQHQPAYEPDSTQLGHKGYWPVPSASPPPTHHRFSSTVSSLSTSPYMGTMIGSHTQQVAQPSELGGSSTPLTGLGVNQASTTHQEPVELESGPGSPVINRSSRQ